LALRTGVIVDDTFPSVAEATEKAAAVDEDGVHGDDQVEGA